MTQPSWTTRNETGLQGNSLRRHGLVHQPFQPAAGDAFIYSDLALDMPANSLLRHLRGSDAPALLMGEPGIGKSTQLTRLMAQGSGLLLFCAFKARPGATLTAIERTIRYHWAQTADAEEATPLPELLRTLCQGAQHPVLAIDDAHLLAPGVLESLLELRRNLRRECERPPGLLLAGEPLLQAILERDAEDGTVEPVTALRLRPLTPEQTEAYLHHRLQAAGARNPSLLSGEAARMIHRESGGLPRAINALANQQLEGSGTRKAVPNESQEAAAVEPARDAGWTSKPWLIPAFTGLIGILVLLALLNIFLSAGGTDAERTDPLSGIESRIVPEATPEPPLAHPEPLRLLPGAPEVPGPASLPVPQAPSLSEPPPAAMAPEPAHVVQAADPETSADATAPETRSLQEPTLSQPETVVLSEHEPQGAGPDPATPEPAASARPGPEPVPPAEAERESDPPAPVTATPSPSTKPETLPQEARPAAPPPAPAATSAPAQMQDSAWIRSRAPDRFTIQIAAGRDLQALRRSARGLPSDVERAWFSSQRDGRNWYTLIAGDYGDRNRAGRAVAELPAQMRRNQPWIRTFGSIHEIME